MHNYFEKLQHLNQHTMKSCTERNSFSCLGKVLFFDTSRRCTDFAAITFRSNFTISIYRKSSILENHLGVRVSRFMICQKIAPSVLNSGLLYFLEQRMSTRCRIRHRRLRDALLTTLGGRLPEVLSRNESLRNIFETRIYRGTMPKKALRATLPLITRRALCLTARHLSQLARSTRCLPGRK